MITEAFARALSENANRIVIAILILVFGFVADKLFHQTFRSMWHGFLDEIAQVAQRKFNMRSLNLIGGVVGALFFILFIAGNSAIVHIFGVETEVDTVPVMLCAGFGTWIYFLLCLSVCKDGRP